MDSSNSISDEAGTKVSGSLQAPLSVSGVTVDTIFPIISSVAKVSSATLFGPNAIVDLVVTFNEPVKITRVPSLTLSVGGSPASADYQDKGESYSLTHTFRYIVGDGLSGSIQVTGLSVDLSNFISDKAENPTAENIQTPLSVSGVTVEMRSCDSAVTSVFNGGDGSESSPYLICTYAQLDKMKDNLTAHYELGQDIDASPSWSAGADGCTAYDGSTVPQTNACTGWVPVGTFETDKCDGETDDVCFQGHLDGSDQIISNLYLNISGSGSKYGGLFGVMGSQAEISSIGLTNASVTVTSSSHSSSSSAGGLVGYNVYGTISNSYATGAVTSSSDSSSPFAGGLVGHNVYGTISNSYATGTVESSISASTTSSSLAGGLVGYDWGGTISNSYATGAVTSSSSDSSSSGGGLVGSIHWRTIISNSYATGVVRVSSSYFSLAGGLVGKSDSGTISNSYATGAVESSTSTSSDSSFSFGGGLVGDNAGTISNSYATGAVESSSSSISHSFVGGLVGRNGGTISNSYATGAVESSSSSSSGSYIGGLVGGNGGTISGTNYFVDTSGTNGLGGGSCSGTCMQKTLAELQALTSVTYWSTDNWDFGTTTQLPRLKYTQGAAYSYCRDYTYTTQQTCEDASESWIGIVTCGGNTRVTCGDVISGQPDPSTLPLTINEITSVQKIYGSDSEVEFVVTFSKAVGMNEGETPFLSLNVGGQTRQANFRRKSGESDTKASFFYEVQLNDNDDDGITLESTLDSNGGNIRDTFGQDLVNTIPQEYRSFPDVKVDAIHPTISSIAKVSSATLFGPNAIVDLVVTFNEPVKIIGVPSFTLSVGGSPASADYQDKGESYSLTHTFRYIVGDGHSGLIQVTGLSVDLSNSISDKAENPTEENIPTPLSVGEVSIEARSCDYAVTSVFNGGDGSESSPYLICTYAQLDRMRDNLTAHYELGQDIDASPSWSAGADGCTAYDGSTVPEINACTGWLPVGNSQSRKCDGGMDDVCFQGHLDGGDHIISNLYLNISGSGETYGGLFGLTGSYAEISNMGLTNVSVTSSSFIYNSYVGGLVGRNGGTISNSYATGAVTSSSFIYNSYVGGLVGRNGGTISNSYATGAVTSSSSFTDSNSYGGGLVGYNNGYGTISNSYATGEVTSSAYDSLGGGLVGYSENGTISNSYATGAVTSSSASYSSGGGLVGNNNGGTISNSYATGEVEASSTSYSSLGGGLVGRNGGTISNSYATGTVMSSSTTTYTGSYGGGLVGRNGGTISNSYATGTVMSSSTTTYTGSYGGGLVGYNSANISNSYATGAVESSSSYYSSYGGGLVGYNYYGTISNSYATGGVTASSSSSYGGGLVGYNSRRSFNYRAGYISNSYATGTVSATSTSGTSYSGGLVGSNGGTISGTNYFVDSSGTNGLASGTCSETTCTQKTLAELQALTSVTDWSTDNWGFGTTTQLPRLKYAPTATYCSDNTYTTQQTCEDASESWVIEGCDGDTGVTCGAVISGQ